MGNLNISQVGATQNSKTVTINDATDELDNAMTDEFAVLIDDSDAVTTVPVDEIFGR